MRIQSFTAEAQVFGKPREVDYVDGTLRIMDLTMTDAQRIIKALELGELDIVCPSPSETTPSSGT